MRLVVKQPLEQYQRVYGQDYRRVYIVGDIHGQLTKLLNQLESVGFDFAQDLLISVGDLIDRGPESKEMLSLLDEPWFTCVRGNHEDLATLAIEQLEEDSVGLWLQNGGTWILRTEVGEERNWCIAQLMKTADLPFVIELITKDHLIVIAHGCYPEREYEYGKKIDGFKVTWDRDLYLARRAGDERHTFGADLFFHGHNHVKEAAVYGNHHYIATGAYGPEPFTIVRVQ